jgi:hypothetical protein
LSLFTATVALGLAQPQDVPAKPGYFVFPGYRESQLTVKGTHGFVISVTQVGHRVELHASKGNASAIYILPMKNPPRESIRAKFPGLGRVSVRFHPSGEPRRSPPWPGCRGGEEVLQKGTFSGTIRFRGERGFTRVAASSAPGIVRRFSKEVCKDSDGNDHSRLEPTYSLVASTKSHGQTAAFTALRPAPGAVFNDGSTYFGSLLGNKRGMTILKYAVAITADMDTFAIGGPPERPTSASVAPSSPFRGTATFQGTTDGQAQWEGTLEVDLPGAPGVKLTGPSFSSRLCLNRRCTGHEPPRPQDQAQLFVQDSGSQSQLFGETRLSWSR